MLENVGIVVAYFDVDNFDDYLSMLSVCTDITGRKRPFELNGLKIKEQIDSIKAEFKKANLPENERSVLLLRAASGFVKAKGSEGTILGEMLSDLGCINIADSDSSLLETLSVESVIRQEPYRIFVVTMGDDTEKALDNFSRMMEENPAWGTLSAVIEGRVHIMDRKLFNIKPNAKWAESCMKNSAKYCLERDKTKYLYAAGFIFLGISALLGIVLGSTQLSLSEITDAFRNGFNSSAGARIFYYVRLPRALASLVCGAALSFRAR